MFYLEALGSQDLEAHIGKRENGDREQLRSLEGMADLMAEDFKEDGDEKGENRSEHPIVQPQTSLNFRSQF